MGKFENMTVKSCCCVSLQVGARIIGVLVLLTGIVSFSLDIVYFGSSRYRVAPLSTDGHRGLGWRSRSPPKNHDIAVAFAGIGLLVDVATIVVAVVLIIGAFKTKPYLLHVFSVTILVLYHIELISTVVVNIIEGFYVETDVFSYLHCFLNLYWALVVHSACLEMRAALEVANGGQ